MTPQLHAPPQIYFVLNAPIHKSLINTLLRWCWMKDHLKNTKYLLHSKEPYQELWVIFINFIIIIIIIIIISKVILI